MLVCSTTPWGEAERSEMFEAGDWSEIQKNLA
jgi:hypothetical protein